MEVSREEDFVIRANLGSTFDTDNILDSFSSEDFTKIEDLLDEQKLLGLTNLLQEELSNTGGSNLPPQNIYADGGVTHNAPGDLTGVSVDSGASLKTSPHRVPPSTHPGLLPGFHGTGSGHGGQQHTTQGGQPHPHPHPRGAMQGGPQPQGPHPSQGGQMNGNTFQNVFPDSPPDTDSGGSEPYSPPNEHGQGQHPPQDPPPYHVKPNGMPSNSLANQNPMYPVNLHGGPPTGPLHPSHPSHPQGPSTGPSQHSSVSPPHPQHPSPPHPHVTVPGHPPGGGRPPYNMYTANEPPKMPPHPSGANPAMPLNVQDLAALRNPISNPISTMNNLSNQLPKKRKHSDSPNGTMNQAIYQQMVTGQMMIKQEPGVPLPSMMPGECDVGYDYDDFQQDPAMFEGTFQVIKWQQFQQTKWATLLDEHGKELPPINYRVDADKGFNHSPSDDAFVCQKKNHFQVTVHIGMSGRPRYVKTTDGTVKNIDSFHLHFNGVKAESTSQTIRVEQSQSDRTKRAFNPVRVDLSPDQVNKYTVGRMHFSETTSNNMRKKGKPNPDQRYFMLVVSLHAHHGDETSILAAHSSERIIVRASNPGQFDSDVDVMWNKGRTPDSVVRMGRVGINTDSPDEALTVYGNMRLTGNIIQPSDMRAKTNIEELDPKEQLERISQMKLYKYEIEKGFAEYAGLKDDEKRDAGVLAQELADVLPDAVKTTGNVTLPDGKMIENFLVVNKDRIFMENVGAVKELCKVTNKLEVRINEMEGINKELTKLGPAKRDSVKSTCSSFSISTCSTISRTNSMPPSEKIPSKKSTTSPLKPDLKPSSDNNNTHSSSHCHRHHHHHSHRHGHHHRSHHHSNSHSSSSSRSGNNALPPGLGETGPCSNRLIQIIVIILVLVMAFCLVAITTLYILEKQSNDQRMDYPHDGLPGSGNDTGQTTESPPNSAVTDYVTEVYENWTTIDYNDTGPPPPHNNSYAQMLTPPMCLTTACPIMCCLSADSVRPQSVTTTLSPPNNDPTKGHKSNNGDNEVIPQGKGSSNPPYHVIGNNPDSNVDGPPVLNPNEDKYHVDNVEYDDDIQIASFDARPQDDTPPDDEDTPPPRPNDTKNNPRFGPSEDDSGPEEDAVHADNEIIDDASATRGDDQTDDDDDETNEIANVPPRVVVMDTSDNERHGYRRKREILPIHEKPAQLRVVQINKTIDAMYCKDNDCVQGIGGNYSYYIPISPVFPLAFITIEFQMKADDQAMEVLLCVEDEPDRCDLPAASEETVEIKAEKGAHHDWDLPVGYYFHSYFKFRIGSVDEDNICGRPVSELGQSFSEYNLMFHRVCDGV